MRLSPLLFFLPVKPFARARDSLEDPLRHLPSVPGIIGALSEVRVSLWWDYNWIMFCVENNPGRPQHHSVEASLPGGGGGKLRGFKKRLLALGLTGSNKTKPPYTPSDCIW